LVYPTNSLRHDAAPNPFGIAGFAHFAKFVGFEINEIKLLLDGEIRTAATAAVEAYC
jgi:hypothetical protein